MWQNRVYSRRRGEKNRAKAGGWLAALLALVFALRAGAPALAYNPPAPPTPNPIADTPAATLLLPYFQVDLKNPNGVTTLFSIANASPNPQLAHVVLWSDLSVHVIDFDVYLTGYGLYRLDLRDLLVNGVTPPTGPGVSHRGLTRAPSSVIVNTCRGILPLPRVPADQLLGVQQALTGQPSVELGGLCAGTRQTDNIARGYITIDDGKQCNFSAPGDDGYLGSPDGRGRLVTDNNVLWGDSFIINQSANKAYAQNLVHILAAPGTFAPGDYTFYGRYDFSAYFSQFRPDRAQPAWQAYDNREPLPTTFLARYINPTSSEGKKYFNGSTFDVVWRDSKVDQDPFGCFARSGNPPWFGLGQEGIAIFDEQEDVITPPSCHFSPCPPLLIPGFPAETQRTGIGPGQPFPTAPFDAGYLWLDLNHATPVGGSPGLGDPGEAGSWVITTFANTSATPGVSSYIVGERANQLDTGNAPNHCVPGPGNLC